MRKLFFFLFTLVSITAVSQTLNKKIEEMQRQAAKQRADLDSIKKVNDSLFLLRIKKNDSADMANYMEQNTRNLVSFMKEREQKQKKAMWLRIGLGLSFLAIGIFAFMRKRKSKTGNSGS